MQQSVPFVCAVFACLFLLIAAFPKITEPSTVRYEWIAAFFLVVGFLVF